MNTIYTAFLLSFLAGTATALGGALSFVVKKKNLALLAAGLGFSAGVMLYVSFMEILPHAQTTLADLYGRKGLWGATGIFFLGTAVAWMVDTFLPPLHIHPKTLDKSAKLKRTGFFTAVALGLHNFPEGLATFLAAMDNMTLGISIAVAVAIHNIPEGMAVALPIYHATEDRKKAFFYSILSGMAEPLGAVIGFFVLQFVFKEAALGVMFALVAGIMVYLSLDELLPTAHDYGDGHEVISGVLAGMAVMAVTLLVF